MFPHGLPVSSPTGGFLESCSAFLPAAADVKSCRSRTMRRLHSMGDIEKIDGPCRQFPTARATRTDGCFGEIVLITLRVMHFITRRVMSTQPKRPNRPRMEGKTAHPNPHFCSWPKRLPSLPISGSIPSLRDRAAPAHGEPARRVAGVSKGDRLVIVLHRGTG